MQATREKEEIEGGKRMYDHHYNRGGKLTSWFAFAYCPSSSRSKGGGTKAFELSDVLSERGVAGRSRLVDGFTLALISATCCSPDSRRKRWKPRSARRRKLKKPSSPSF